ncbi:MAG: hypothetical protein MJ142_05400 [Clostridia bacterium]|nr:hypothetical protein [Clostridia bacterium]
MTKYKKQYVDVDVAMTADGTMLPRVIHWTDDQTFEITKVRSITPAPALKAGGQGDRYTILTEGRERFLFFERPTDADPEASVGRWFVEAPYYEPDP